MVARSCCLSFLALSLAGVDGRRSPDRASASTPSTKFIGGVPVLNYETAYGGQSYIQVESAVQQWVAVLQKGISQQQIDELCNLSNCNIRGHAGGFQFIQVRGTEADLEKLKGGHGRIRYFEPDTEVHAIPEVPGDRGDPLETLWGLERVGAYKRDASGSGVTIFVTDTGVRTTHEEFGGRAIPTLDMTSGSPVECDGDTGCAVDRQGHGTHCAGTVAGVSYGVAPGATVRSVKVLSDSGSGSWSWSYGALDWIATSSVRPAVTSMSLGGRGNQQAMKDAVDAACDAGVTVVVAGGNSNADSCDHSPAFVLNAITVGSTDSNDRRSSFSNYGRCTDMWAPGSSIKSAGHTSDTASATFSGTSMACPHVAGGAALVLQKNADFNHHKVLEALYNAGKVDAISDLRDGDTNKFLYVESVGGPSPSPSPGGPIQVGSRVRVRSSVERPKFGWGAVTPDSVGEVLSTDTSSDTCRVDYPEQQRWLALLSEMEVVEDPTTPPPTPAPIVEGSRVHFKPELEEPHHGWGPVSRDSVGTVIGINANKSFWVDFPEQQRWLAVPGEMEALPDSALVEDLPDNDDDGQGLVNNDMQVMHTDSLSSFSVLPLNNKMQVMAELLPNSGVALRESHSIINAHTLDNLRAQAELLPNNVHALLHTPLFRRV